MSELPRLTGDCVTLRPLTLADAPRVAEYAGAREIADVTLSIPHPYERHMAKEWIAGHPAAFQRGEQAVFGIARPPAEEILGVISFQLNAEHRRGELGYWIGIPHWGNGYCTEAARTLLRYGFEALDLHRVTAYHVARNPASGRVMRKIGMSKEGLLRGHIQKWDRFEDVVVYGLLRSEWAEGKKRLLASGEKGKNFP